MRNSYFPHSPIVYDTRVSPTIKMYYTLWKRSVDLKDGEAIRNRLFLQFIESCEIENEYYMDIINKLGR